MSSIDDNAHSLDNSIRRAPMVVYGKRSNSNPLLSRVPPTGELEQFSEHDRIHDTRTASSPSPSVRASDSELSRASGSVDPFQFDFRHRLKELDEQFDDHDAQPSKPGVPPSRKAMRAGPSQLKDSQSVSMGTPILSPQARHSSGNASLSPSPTSLRVTKEHPLASPLLRRRARGIRNRVLSDSEAEGPSDSSSVSPVRHAITTPHTRSSPTPPTSGEIPMLSRKTKGKMPARDVLPLLFETEPSVVEVPIKSKKGRRSELPACKTKAPTKKERREAALESSRIAANRPVEVHRTQQSKYTLAKFLTRVRQDGNVPSTSGTELPSDPIERFSSPNDKSTRAPPPRSVFGEPTGLLASSSGTSKQSSPAKIPNIPPLAAADSDDEMPSITAIIQQASGKKEERLQEAKQNALRRADMGKTLGEDSDDDGLLIVKDDMHAVAREEAAQRRLDKAHRSPVKDIALLRRINHPSARPVPVSPLKFSKQELEELAQPSFARTGNEAKSRLSKNQLDQLMISRHNTNQLESIKRHEAEWVKGGGRLSRDSGNITQTSLSQRLEAYAEQGLKTVEAANAVADDESTDESDEEYTPDVRGSESPQPMATDEADPADNILQSPQPIEGDDGEEEEVFAPSKRNKYGQRRPRVVLGSDDEEDQLAHHPLPTVQRDSTSSMESQTEDENDKENSAKLMYDRSDDKENKAVARHESSSAFTLGSSLGSLHVVEDSVRRSLPLVSVTGFNVITGSPNEDVRSPLKDISKDEDDPFLSSQSKSPFTECLLSSAARSPPRSCLSTLSLGSPPVLRSERTTRMNRLCSDPETDENNPPEVKALQPSFLERLHSQVNPESSSLASLNPLANGGFSQLFSAEDQCLKRPVDGAENDGLSLTLDIGLKPALEISGVLQQKAEAIFEKEQEYVVAAAVQQNDRSKEHLYINDHGFLTQTRPEESSPEVCRMAPFQMSKLAGTQVHTTQTQLSARPPLRTLSFSASLDFSPETQPLRRLHQRSASPLQQRALGQKDSPDAKLNSFNILGKPPKPPSKGQNEKQKKSEFVAVEAEESDEDDMFGFGGPKGDDDEEDDDDQDKVVDGLVDDMAMDAETEAVDLVQEKYREHEEQDDERLQKLHQDAIEGKLRMKRRGLGVDLEDNSDEDEDDDHRIRQRIYKKRKIEGDTLEALGQNEETRAFYNTYHQDLIDEDDDFAHLREDIIMPVDDGTIRTEEPEQETVSVDEIRQRVRDLAQNNSEVDVLNPEDTSWIDRSMVIEPDEGFRVKVMEYRRGITTGRRPNAGPLDFERLERPVDNKEREQLRSWAKNQRPQYQGTGRSGNSAAVTGHKKGGSLRSTRLSNSARTVSEPHKVKTSRSLLCTVSDRSGKFA
ncbi:hypothetical protein JVU11DRAFT_1371 [Chiua virens]|nr:hypothetical protein JVU11DRAFT_1371 [Chiua virens]